MAIALIALIVLAAAICLAPVHVEIVLSKNAGAVRLRARIRWLVFSWRVDDARRRRHERNAAKRRRHGRRSPFDRVSVRALLSSRGFAERCVRLGAGLIRWVAPDDVRASARIGFEDPSETGMFVGGALALCRGAGLRRVSVTPDFSGEVLEGRMRVRWSRNLASALWPVVSFAASPVVWRAVRASRRRPSISRTHP